MKPRPKPHPTEHPWWRFDGKQTGRVKRILPGGSGDLGIVELDGPVPSAHVATMMHFAAWQPTTAPVALEPPCACVALEGGAALSEGCTKHSAAGAIVDPTAETEPRRLTG